ncbi:hypothetical protein [Novosphingobium sp.]|uniref:hypothetical protein n=1 Tax=Novosphingobium sp. TaxID=1874826 RepID=UPI001D3F4D78|nr:hypothetical protein [Novosphingobium sp.]MBX9662257.1 hypothetical protein [Novosphingobium sp.]
MISSRVVRCCASVAIAALVLEPLPLLAQALPQGPAYPTAPTPSAAPRPRQPAGNASPPSGGTTVQVDAQRTGTPVAAPPARQVELPNIDVQLANGWITQQQHDAITAQVRAENDRLIRLTTDNIRDAIRAQQQLSDGLLESISSLVGGGTPDVAELQQALRESGYEIPPGTLTDDPRRSAEALMNLLDQAVRTEQNAGNVVRPIMQEQSRVVDRLVVANIEALRETGQIPPDMLREYERLSANVHDRAIARIDRLLYEHDRQVENVARVLNERRDTAVTQLSNGITAVRDRYGSDPRNWPQAPGQTAPQPGFTYGGVLTAAWGRPGSGPQPPAPPPPPPPNPHGLPPLGEPTGRPLPGPEANETPSPTPEPISNTPRRPVRRGTVPTGDPYEGLRVPQQQPVPPRPRPTPPPRVPDPVVLTEVRRTPPPSPVVLNEVRRDPVADELGRDTRAPSTGSSGNGGGIGGMIESVMARIPRNRDGSIDWARVPLAIRAQIILYQSRHPSGGGATGGFGQGGASSDDPQVAELARGLDEQIRLQTAAARQWEQDANWRRLVEDRFSDGAWGAFARNGGLTVLELEPIYADYDPLGSVPPARSLSSAGTSLSSAGNSLSSAGISLSSVPWSLSSAGLDYRDPAVESLNQVLYGVGQYRRGPFASGGSDIDTARAAQMAYNAGSFDVRYNRSGSESFESGGRLVGSLFGYEESWLRLLTANGAGGIDTLLAQPFNVVLTWGDKSFDLDLHMTGPLGPDTTNRFHIYFDAQGDLANQPFAKLIKDCICASGSEVILTSALNRGGVYRVSVFNFGDPSATSTNLSALSNARIEIVRGGTTQSVGNGTTIIGGRTIVSVNVPNVGAGNTWVAAELDPSNGRITRPGIIRQSPGSAGVD